MHLFVDISGHGFGHLAITAPVLHALAERGDLRLTVRSSLPAARLRERLPSGAVLISGASDFGFVMQDALCVDRPASAAAYQAAHADWSARVAAESQFLQQLKPDLVLSNVSYLPLAGAADGGLPAVALCSLNWADLFAHFFAGEPWAEAIHRQMLAAYRSARAFLRVTPAMPMPALPNQQVIAPIAHLAMPDRARANTALARLRQENQRLVLVAMGGIDHVLPVDRWPRLPGIHWLIPGHWPCTHPDATAFESLGLAFTDVLQAVDAVVTKPGYGTFAEAACNGTPVLYQRRADWPEQDCLIDWLATHGACREISAAALSAGELADDLAALWALPRPVPPRPDGAQEAAEILRVLVADGRG